MRLTPKKAEVIKLITLCDELEFLKQWEKRIASRSYQIIFMRHGHFNYKKLSWADIAHHIPIASRTQYETISDRQISRLYYMGLGKIKELMGNYDAIEL